MSNNNPSWRDSRISLAKDTVTFFQPTDTNPNYYYIVNNGSGNIKASASPALSSTTFDLVVPGYGSRSYAKPVPIHGLYLLADAATEIYIAHMEVDFHPAMMAQTQEISTVGATGVLGTVNVGIIAAGDNNIGNVDIVTLPALVAGDANIGNVDVVTLPALVAGDANIGNVDVVTLPALPAGDNNIGNVDVVTLPALVAGNANIGNVDLASPYPEGATPFIVTATSGANAEATATIAAETGKTHYVLGFVVALRGAAAGNDALVTIKDGTTVKYTDVIGNAATSGSRVGFTTSVPMLKGTANTALVLTAGAAGAAAVTELNLWGYTI